VVDFTYIGCYYVDVEKKTSINEGEAKMRQAEFDRLFPDTPEVAARKKAKYRAGDRVVMNADMPGALTGTVVTGKKRWTRAEPGSSACWVIDVAVDRWPGQVTGCPLEFLSKAPSGKLTPKRIEEFRKEQVCNRCDGIFDATKNDNPRGNCPKCEADSKMAKMFRAKSASERAREDREEYEERFLSPLQRRTRNGGAR
jgi:hypothetical protein